MKKERKEEKEELTSPKPILAPNPTQAIKPISAQLLLRIQTLFIKPTRARQMPQERIHKHRFHAFYVTTICVSEIANLFFEGEVLVRVNGGGEWRGVGLEMGELGQFGPEEGLGAANEMV